jgi:hypothetical protein
LCVALDKGTRYNNPQTHKADLAKRAEIPEHIDLNDPSNVWELNFKDLKTHFGLNGYEAVIKPARASSLGKSRIFQLNNHIELSEAQYHPGGGVCVGVNA